MGFCYTWLITITIKFYHHNSHTIDYTKRNKLYFLTSNLWSLLIKKISIINYKNTSKKYQMKLLKF